MRLRLLFLSLVSAVAVSAAVKPAFLFSDGMILQRDKPAPVWGTADAHETITVRFDGREHTARADASGRWRLDLPALPASASPRTLEIAGSAPGDRVRINGVLVGEVWIASGQSNMAWTVAQSDRANEEIASALYPQIREFRVKTRALDHPTTEGLSDKGWVATTPASVGNFSAVAFYFARELHRVDKVPVGIINASWGGTRIESWIGAGPLAANPDFAVIGERWHETLQSYPQRKDEYDRALAVWREEEAAARAKGLKIKRSAPRAPVGAGHYDAPSSIYNGVIAPLVPYSIAGFIWYQGEGNVLLHREYAALFETMIRSWRADFRQGDLPFYFAQLSNFETVRDPSRQAWAFLREAQARVLSLPATELAVTIDIGNPRDIHPGNKQEVGRRLALLVQNKLRGSGVDYSGPRLIGSSIEDGQIRLRFSHLAGGLTLDPGPYRGLEIAGEDRRFHSPVEARIEGDSLVVWSAQVPAPRAVRYAWRNAPDLHLANGLGLPAMPFRTDDWAD